MNFIITILCSLFLLNACSDNDSHRHPKDITAKALFDLHCATCHQETGKGRFLKGIPPNKNTFLAIEEIAHKIRAGEHKNSVMPVYKNMDEKEAIKIATYLVKEL